MSDSQLYFVSILSILLPAMVAPLLSSVEGEFQDLGVKLSKLLGWYCLSLFLFSVLLAFGASNIKLSILWAAAFVIVFVFGLLAYRRHTALILWFSRSSSTNTRHQYDLLFWLFVLLAGVSITVNAFLAINTPVFGWDALQFWSERASELLKSDCIRIVGCGVVDNKHPDYLVYYQAYLAKVSFTPNPLFTWCLPVYGLSFLIFAHLRSIASTPAWVPALFALLLSSLPIVTSSITITGYAGIIVASYTATAALAFSMAIGNHGARGMVFVGTACSLFASTIKAGGYLFAMVPVLAFLIIIVCQYRLVRILGLISVLMVAVLLFTKVGIRSFDFSFPGYAIQYFSTTNKLVLNTFSISFTPSSTLDVAASLYYGFIKNMSFSISFFVLMLTGAVAVMRGSKMRGDIYFLLTMFLYSLILLLLLWFVPHFYIHSLPSSDTGLTRHSQTIVLTLLTLAFPVLLRERSKSPDQSSDHAGRALKV